MIALWPTGGHTTLLMLSDSLEELFSVFCSIEDELRTNRHLPLWGQRKAELCERLIYAVRGQAPRFLAGCKRAYLFGNSWQQLKPTAVGNAFVR